MSSLFVSRRSKHARIYNETTTTNVTTVWTIVPEDYRRFSQPPKIINYTIINDHRSNISNNRRNPKCVVINWQAQDDNKESRRIYYCMATIRELMSTDKKYLYNDDLQLVEFVNSTAVHRGGNSLQPEYKVCNVEGGKVYKFQLYSAPSDYPVDDPKWGIPKVVDIKIPKGHNDQYRTCYYPLDKCNV
jgi:hypothetical protein